MNFFEHQAHARRKTTYMVVLLIVVTVLTPTLLAALLIALIDTVQWELPLTIFVLTLPFVAAGYWYECRRLKGGGSAIAERLGGELISLEPRDDDERQILNIVEEMAIASGCPVPPVYFLDEAGINAFTVGISPQDSVIGITDGALIMLNRDELQGVVAHAFSQIYNNDTRLDARMSGAVGGTFFMSVLAALAGGGPVIGAILFMIGLGWVYIGDLILAKLYCQRKFLADASAVQLTRNPQSIVNTLKKIGGYEYEGRLVCDAAAFSQTFFISPSGFGRDTVLEERIWRIDPDWDGEYPDVPPFDSLIGDSRQAIENRSRWEVLGAATVLPQAFNLTDVAHGINSIGTPSAAHLYQARMTLKQLPEAVKAAAHNCSGAQALIYRLLLNPNPELQACQLESVRPFLNDEVARGMQDLHEPTINLDPYLRLSLIDLCIPALKQLLPDQYKVFRANMHLLINVDNCVDIVEWILLNIVERNVLGWPKAGSRFTLRQLASDVGMLLGALAAIGNNNPAQARTAYYRASDKLPYLPPPQEKTAGYTPDDLDSALVNLRHLKPQEKANLFEAMMVCIEQDGHITPKEIELMRVTADLLECPMPPLLATP